MAKRDKQPTDQVSASQLKARCSAILEQVVERRQAVVVTRRGRPVARIVPIESEPRSLFGFARGTITVRGDVIAPIDVEWESAK